MNNEVQQPPAKHTIETFACESLNDEQYCKYHHAILALVSAGIKEANLPLPMGLYCKYKGFVELSGKVYRKIQAADWGDMHSDHLKDMYRCYREQTEEQYRIVCQWIVAAYHKTVLLEEREVLKSIIDGIHSIIKK